MKLDDFFGNENAVQFADLHRAIKLTRDLKSILEEVPYLKLLEENCHAVVVRCPAGDTFIIHALCPDEHKGLCKWYLRLMHGSNTYYLEPLSQFIQENFREE